MSRLEYAHARGNPNPQTTKPQHYKPQTPKPQTPNTEAHCVTPNLEPCDRSLSLPSIVINGDPVSTLGFWVQDLRFTVSSLGVFGV